MSPFSPQPPQPPHTTPPDRTAKRNVTLLFPHGATPSRGQQGAPEPRLRRPLLLLLLMADARFQERTPKFQTPDQRMTCRRETDIDDETLRNDDALGADMDPVCV